MDGWMEGPSLPPLLGGEGSVHLRIVFRKMFAIPPDFAIAQTSLANRVRRLHRQRWLEVLVLLRVPLAEETVRFCAPFGFAAGISSFVSRVSMPFTCVFTSWIASRIFAVSLLAAFAPFGVAGIRAPPPAGLRSIR